MRYIEKIGKVILILYLVGCVLTLVVLVAIISQDSHESPWPTDGVWYCDELEMQLSFDSGGECTAIIDDEITNCKWSSNLGSNIIRVYIVRPNGKVCVGDNPIFEGTFISIKDDELTLRDRETKEKYIFIKIG